MLEADMLKANMLKANCMQTGDIMPKKNCMLKLTAWLASC